MNKLNIDAKLRTGAIGLFFLAMAALLGGCEGEVTPEPPAAPAPSGPVPINTATGWSDSPFISGDGQRLYFMYSRYDFGPWIVSGGARPPVLSGPNRQGLRRSSNPFEESDIYMSTRNPDGTWSNAVNLGLNGNSADSSGMEINGGNTFVWLKGNGTNKKIVIAHRNPDGTWGDAIDPGPGINNHSPGVIQDNPHLSADGKGLWFTSNRAGGAGLKDIWFSSFSGVSWSAPVSLGARVNTAGGEDQFWYSPITNEMYWNGPAGVMRCTGNGTICVTPPAVVFIPECVLSAEVSFTDDGQRMYFGCGDAISGRVMIMYSVKQGNGTWGPATPVD